jgi:hypothetical protein
MFVKYDDLPETYRKNGRMWADGPDVWFWLDKDNTLCGDINPMQLDSKYYTYVGTSLEELGNAPRRFNYGKTYEEAEQWFRENYSDIYDDFIAVDF